MNAVEPMTSLAAVPVRPARGLAWPDKARWRAYIQFMLVFYLLFFPVYVGTQYLAPPRPGFALFFAWEAEIPFVPWMIWPYLSLFTLFTVPLLQMTAGEMRRLSLQSTIPLLVAAVCFLAFPCRSGFPPLQIDGFHRPIFEALHAIDTPQNLVPSLHVAFSGLILLGAREVADGVLRPFYLAWLMLMLCSVMLVHQHHIADVASGLVLVAVARIAFPLTGTAGR
jgi:hypothetical protein